MDLKTILDIGGDLRETTGTRNTVTRAGVGTEGPQEQTVFPQHQGIQIEEVRGTWRVSWLRVE